MATASVYLFEEHYYLDETYNLIHDFKQHLVKDRNLSKATAYTYGSDLKRFFDWVDRPFNAVDRGKIVEYVRSLADKGLSGKTRNRQLSAIKTFYDYVVSETELLEVNPSSSIRGAKVEKRLQHEVSAFDIDIMLSVVDNLRDRVIFEILYGIGCRRAELMTITKSDLNYRSEEIRVFGKGNKERIVPINSDAMALVKEWADSHDSQWLFPSSARKGQHLSTRAINKIVTYWAKKAGLSGKGITPHKFRHSFGTHLFENGADIKVIADMMGHASMNTTQLYAKISKERNRREYQSAHPRAKKAAR